MKVSRTGEVAAFGSTERTEPRSPARLEKQDRVSTERTEEVNQAIAVARKAAASARLGELQAVEAKIRAGSFKPSASAIAERLLQAAEIERALQSALRR
jgi:hypothetical protein